MNCLIFGEKITFDEDADNAQHKADLIEDTIFDLLVALTSTLETPLVETVYNHNRRCGEIVSAIIERIDLSLLSQKDRVLLHQPKIKKYMILSCNMHDLGKSQTPSHLLMQPSRLTKAEMTMIKDHTVQPTTMLFDRIRKHNNAFINVLEDCVRSHHECYNGTGYPDFLVGDDIPLVGRLMAIADTFDNLVNKTVYTDPSSFEDAQAIILSQSSIRFDPVLVSAFKSAEPELRKIMSH